jgi:hypothetical protein
MKNTHSWFNTILLTIIICAAVWFLYPKNTVTAPTTTTTNIQPTTPTTIQFNVPQNEAHNYPEEKEVNNE